MKRASIIAIAFSFALVVSVRSANDPCQSVSPGQSDKKETGAKPKRAAVDPNKFAIIVSGAGGEEIYTKKFTAQATELYGALTNRLGFDEKNVYLLTEVLSGGPENGSREGEGPVQHRSTAEEVRKAFQSVKTAAKPDSLVLIVLIGHGSFDSQQAKFNLVGPDLSGKDFAQLIGSILARPIVFINCSSSSGEFIKPLSGENRIIITSTRSGNEQNATIFAEHFVAAIDRDEADADKNGRVSVLEAFDYATKTVAEWYKKQNRLATEHALIDDNGDGAGHESATAGDGPLAKTTYFDSKTAEQAAGDAELKKMITERGRLEQEVEKLKARKDQMKAEDYERELENLLVELAKVSRDIRARQK